MKQAAFPFGWIHFVFHWHLPVFVWRWYYGPLMTRVCTECERRKAERYPVG